MGPASRFRVLNAEPAGYSAKARAAIERVADMVDGPFSREELLAEVASADGLIVRFGHRIDRELFVSSAVLQVVSTATTGLDHIDLDAAAESGVDVLSLKGEVDFLKTIRATSEHTWSLLLALLRRVHRAHAHVESGAAWDRDRFRGSELAGRRLGIVGYGRIGSHVCEYGQAFKMDVMAYDPNVDRWPEDQAHAPNLASMLRRTDILTLHVPLNEETQGLIGRRELETLPPGAFLINTSRGGVVDEEALLEALRSGHLAGAALDVAADEAGLLAGDGPGRSLIEYARTHDNLLITPHIGGATHESMERTEIFMAEKLVKRLRRPVDEPGPPGEGEDLT